MKDALFKIWWVGLGGFLGANARYWLGVWFEGRSGGPFPWATFAINVVSESPRCCSASFAASNSIRARAESS